MVVFCYALEPPYLTWSVINPDGTVGRGPTPIDGVDEPLMIHDMALTSRHLVLILAPAFFDIAGAMRGGSFLAWRPEQGTRIALVPRDGGPVRWASDEAFWVWHTVNAYEDPTDDGIVLDYVQWPAISLGQDPAQGATAHRGLTRAVIDPVAGTVRRTQLDDASVEFPASTTACSPDPTARSPSRPSADAPTDCFPGSTTPCGGTPPTARASAHGTGTRETSRSASPSTRRRPAAATTDTVTG